MSIIISAWENEKENENENENESGTKKGDTKERKIEIQTKERCFK